MKVNIALLIILAIIITIFGSLIGVGTVIKLKSLISTEEPQSDFIWIDNNRVHVDSLITTRPIFNEVGEQEGLWIKVTYQGSDVFIECVDELGYTWEEWSESWLMAFKEKTE